MHDGLYLSTDTPSEKNHIYRLSREGKIDQIGDLASSSIYGCRVGEAMFFSTMVEPSAVNPSQDVHLVGSANGSCWQMLARWKKDNLPMRYFQYGNAFLPDGENTTQLSRRHHHCSRHRRPRHNALGSRNPMRLARRIHYYQRIFSAYLGSGRSQLTFWHETPDINPRATSAKLGEYYMKFREKADYAGHHDPAGIPMLDYRGVIGLQYNPIAIAQWGLANYNIFCETGDDAPWQKTLKAADWLVANLEQNPHGLWVWNHHFDWDYRDTLKSPWYSGLAQGQGISLLLRAHVHSRIQRRKVSTRRRKSICRAHPADHRRRCALRRRREKSLDRRVSRRSADAHPERIHVGACGECSTTRWRAPIRPRKQFSIAAS